jgi:hypothetical protein
MQVRPRAFYSAALQRSELLDNPTDDWNFAVLFEYIFHFIFGQPAILPQLAPFVHVLHPKHMYYVANTALGDNQIQVDGGNSVNNSATAGLTARVYATGVSQGASKDGGDDAVGGNDAVGGDDTVGGDDAVGGAVPPAGVRLNRRYYLDIKTVRQVMLQQQSK